MLCCGISARVVLIYGSGCRLNVPMAGGFAPLSVPTAQPAAQ